MFTIRNIILYSILGCLLSIGGVRSQVDFMYHQPIDSQQISLTPSIRLPDPKDLSAFAKEGNFVYNRKMQQYTSIGQQLKTWLQEVVKPFFSDYQSNKLLKSFLYFAILIGVGFTIYKIRQLSLQGIMYKNKSMKTLFQDGHSALKGNDADLDVLIQEAISNKEFREAVRVYYLKTLKQLEKRHIIRIGLEKTNQDYLEEIPNLVLKERFRELTYIFEYIWYGQFSPDFNLFQKAAQYFKIFNQQIDQNS